MQVIVGPLLSFNYFIVFLSFFYVNKCLSQQHQVEIMIQCFQLTTHLDYNMPCQ